MKNKESLREALTKAFRAAIEEVGMETFKQCSFFGSADCNRKAVQK